MKKLLFSLLIAMLVALTIKAQNFPGDPVSTLRHLSAEEALEQLKADNPGVNGDFYLVESADTTVWKIFVNPEPLKNWGHECYVYDMPRVINSNQQVMVNPEILNFPPAAMMSPLDVTTIPSNSNDYAPILPPVQDNPVLNPYATHTYAIILSGGGDIGSNYIRFWNDCSFIYKTLRYKYGIPKDHIYPLMADGDDPELDTYCNDFTYISQNTDLDGDGEKDIYKAATSANFIRTYHQINKQIKEGDHLFIFVIDHGAVDEDLNLAYIQLWGTDQLFETEFASTIEQFTKKGVLVSAVLGQCHSGMFVDNLQKVGCIVASACQPHEKSNATADLEYDTFVHEWTSAMNQAKVDGSTISGIDSNDDNKISMYEAFIYASANDNTDEQPMYSSTPENLGTNLSFMEIPAMVDPFVKMYESETGASREHIVLGYYSPYIWIRNSEDGIFEPQSPRFGYTDYVYTRVYNRGLTDYESGQKISVYWSLETNLKNRDSWLNENNDVLFPKHGCVGTLEIPAIEAGGFVDVVMPFSLARYYGLTDKAPILGLLAEIQNSDETTSNLLSSVSESMRQSNDIAVSQITIMNNLNISYVCNIPYIQVEEGAFSLEFIPMSGTRLISNGYVDVSMDKSTARNWISNGSQYSGCEMIGSDDDGNTHFKIIFGENLINGITLSASATAEIGVKACLTKLSSVSSQFKMLIKDANNNIIREQLFNIPAPNVGQMLVNATTTSDGEIELSVDDEYNSVIWTNSEGTTVGTENVLTVVPNIGNYSFCATAVTPDGTLAEGEISLEDMFGIKEVVAEGGTLRVKLHTQAPQQATIVVSSTTDGSPKCTANVETATAEMSIDILSLQSGIYTVSYFINSILVNSVNLSIN